MSGLTVGYLGIDSLVLELKMKTGNEEEKKEASEVIVILEQHHHLLVTLLVANAGAMETLPICLNQLVDEVTAVIISVTAVLIFGEVIPQAICTGPNQIKIAALVAPLTKALMIFDSIIAFPLAKILDCLLGEHGKNRYQNNDLKALIELHSVNSLKEIEEMGKQEGVGLSVHQTKLINGTIDLISVSASDIMLPYKHVVAISDNEIISQEFMQNLNKKGYSRYPVYKGGNKNNVIGILMIKRLIGLSVFDQTLEKLKIPLRKPLIIRPTMPLSDLLVEFEKGKSHMALVTEQTDLMQRMLGLDSNNSLIEQSPADLESSLAKPLEILGIITLERIFEKALGR